MPAVKFMLLSQKAGKKIHIADQQENQRFSKVLIQYMTLKSNHGKTLNSMRMESSETDKIVFYDTFSSALEKVRQFYENKKDKFYDDQLYFIYEYSDEDNKIQKNHHVSPIIAEEYAIKDLRKALTDKTDAYLEKIKHRFYATDTRREVSIRQLLTSFGKISADAKVGEKLPILIGRILHESAVVKTQHMEKAHSNVFFYFYKFFTSSALANLYEQVVREHSAHLLALGYDIKQINDQEKLRRLYYEFAKEQGEDFTLLENKSLANNSKSKWCNII